MLSKVKQKPKSKLSLQTVYKLTRETTHASPALSIGGQTLLQFLSPLGLGLGEGINLQILIFVLPLASVITSRRRALTPDTR